MQGNELSRLSIICCASQLSILGFRLVKRNSECRKPRDCAGSLQEAFDSVPNSRRWKALKIHCKQNHCFYSFSNGHGRDTSHHSLSAQSPLYLPGIQAYAQIGFCSTTFCCLSPAIVHSLEKKSVCVKHYQPPFLQLHGFLGFPLTCLL